MADRPPRTADGAGVPDAELARLRHLAFVVLSPALGTHRRATIADDLARSSLAEEAGYDRARAHLVAQVLHSGHRPRRLSGLGLGSPSTGEPATAALAAMMPAARAAYVLIRLEHLSAADAEAVLREAGVPDPRTAVGLAERSDLAAEDVGALTVPVAAGVSRTRLVLAAAVVLVVAVAAPVIASVVTGGDDIPVPVSSETSDGKTPPSSGTPATDPARAVKAAQLERDLARILVRIEEQLDRQKPGSAEIVRLRTLRAAVLAEQERLRAN
ncbi:MAG: hypothetical protein ACT4P1_00020 [Sporichthyaceae bacterium]